MSVGDIGSVMLVEKPHAVNLENESLLPDNCIKMARSSNPLKVGELNDRVNRNPQLRNQRQVTDFLGGFI